MQRSCCVWGGKQVNAHALSCLVQELWIEDIVQKDESIGLEPQQLGLSQQPH